MHNIVFEILLSYEQQKNWKKAFFDVIPPRKVCGSIPQEGQVENNGDTNAVNESAQPSEDIVVQTEITPQSTCNIGKDNGTVTEHQENSSEE